MEELSNDIHIGKIIENEMKRRGSTKTWLAKQLCCDHSNVFHILKRKSMDTDLLLKISLILETDFFEYYRQEFAKNVIHEE